MKARGMHPTGRDVRDLFVYEGAAPAVCIVMFVEFKEFQ